MRADKKLLERQIDNDFCSLFEKVMEELKGNKKNAIEDLSQEFENIIEKLRKLFPEDEILKEINMLFLKIR